ncbi:MAG: hypothetical protein CTY18_04025 [Methylomonas sp.]|nr:MAG: hypothetical protein CTY18_04025 [Methylomonas sp.]
MANLKKILINNRMFFILKRLASLFLGSIVLIAGIFYFQGWQYWLAYTGGGFANAQPGAIKTGAKQVCNSTPINVVSFNVMYGSSLIEDFAAKFLHGKTGAGELPWSMRKADISQRIANYQPDLIGLQEMGEDHDVAEIVPLDQYSLVAYHNKDFQYDDAALLYKTKRFEQLEVGQVWLGKKPELPLSLGFKPLSVIRYINWVLLRERLTGFTFIYANTHFDNAGVNKDPSATLFRERIANLAKTLPVVVTGDFNTRADTERYQRLAGFEGETPLLKNTYQLAEQKPDDPLFQPAQRIDHILAGGPCQLMVSQWLIDQRLFNNGDMLSDHGLVFARLQFATSQNESK